MEVHMDYLTNFQSTKLQTVQKVQKFKKYIKNKNTKIEMYKPTKIQKTLGCQLLVQKGKREQSLKRAKKALVPVFFHKNFR